MIKLARIAFTTLCASFVAIIADHVLADSSVIFPSDLPPIQFIGGHDLESLGDVFDQGVAILKAPIRV